MPLITRPIIKPSEIKDGDRLLYTDALDEDSKVPAMPLIEGREYPSKGKHKGKVLVKVKGKAEPLPLDREDGIIVEREIPTQEERDAHVVAFDRWYALSRVVDAMHKYLEAVRAMQGLAQRLDTGGWNEVATTFRGGVTRQTASDLDSAAGYLRGVWESTEEVARSEGWTYDFLLDLARNHHAMGKGTTIYHFQPQPPRNADCFEDGLPAGGGWTCVPLSRAQHEAQQAAREGDPEPRPLLVDRYAARRKVS
jgi:hypothetical protein